MATLLGGLAEFERAPARAARANLRAAHAHLSLRAIRLSGLQRTTNEKAVEFRSTA
jgi:hypothetical protein